MVVLMKTIVFLTFPGSCVSWDYGNLGKRGEGRKVSNLEHMIVIRFSFIL